MKRLSLIAAALFLGCFPASAGTLTISPDALVFPDTTVGGTSSLNVQTFATPASDLNEVSANSHLSSDLSGTMFSLLLTGSCPTLAPDACNWTVVFAPTALGTFTETLVFRVIFFDEFGGDLTEPLVSLNVSGTAVAPSDVPLPPAMALFATSLGALGLVAWRRRKLSV